jgi:hypothetical protein
MKDQVLLTKIVIENNAVSGPNQKILSILPRRLSSSSSMQEEARAIGRRGKERVYTLFSASRMAEETVWVYKATLGLCGKFSPSR